MPPKAPKPGEKKGGSDREPVPMDPKAASRAIGRIIDTRRVPAPAKPAAPAAPPAAKTAVRPGAARGRKPDGVEPATKILSGPPPRLAEAKQRVPPKPPATPKSKPEPPAPKAERPPAAPPKPAPRPAAPGDGNAKAPASGSASKAPAAAKAPEPEAPARAKPAPPPPAPAAEKRPEPPAKAPAPAPEPPPAAAEPPPEPPAPSEDLLLGSPIDTKVLLSLLEDTPGSLLEAWIRVQAGDSPERALKISKTEVEFLVLQKSPIE
ncbi:MAG: hypothetical protein MUC63_09305 [Planctomycetes bacterium]|nr:hypothetical protein [Planctomycetota bacterium]